MLRDWCSELVQMPESVWIRYAMSREPLARKLSLQEYADFCAQARDCGIYEAIQLKYKYPNLTLMQLADKLGVRVELREQMETGLPVFACFEEPDLVWIAVENAQAVQDLIETSQSGEILKHPDIINMLLAHELFHVIQMQKPELFVNQPVIQLWKKGPFHRSSRLPSLEEYAAMAFARELTDMETHPYLYDVLMLLPRFTPQAKQLYEKLQEFWQEERT